MYVQYDSGLLASTGMNLSYMQVPGHRCCWLGDGGHSARDCRTCALHATVKGARATTFWCCKLESIF